MHGDELPLQVASELGNLQAVHLRAQIVAVAFGIGGFLQVDDAGIPTGQLDGEVAEVLGPFGNVRQAIEGCLITHELGEENRGSFDLCHGCGFIVRQLAMLADG